MPTLLKNQTKVTRNPVIMTSGGGNLYLNPNEFFFYSNSPETLNSSDMADSGKFLNRVNVSGMGQIYTWHANQTGRTINSCILIYNPNSYAIQVKVTNYGLTNDSTQTQPDCVAWKQYYNGQSTTVTVAAGGYGNLFLRPIASGNHFGIVARVNVIKSGTSTAASITMFDLAYFTNSGAASNFAEADPISSLRAKGKGAGFYATITFPTVAPTNTNGVGFKLGANDSYFSGEECSYIVDPNNDTSGRLQGAFGQQFQITIPIKNITGTAQKFRVFIGSRGGNAFPFVNFSGDITFYTTAIDGTYKEYLDVIETDIIVNGGTTNITFSTVIPAMSHAPYFIGVRTV